MGEQAPLPATLGAVAPPFPPFESLRTGFDFPQGERAPPGPTPAGLPLSEGFGGGGTAAPLPCPSGFLPSQE